jgi:flagellar basal-body rod protein FlgB
VSLGYWPFAGTQESDVTAARNTTARQTTARQRQNRTARAGRNAGAAGLRLKLRSGVRQALSMPTADAADNTSPNKNGEQIMSRLDDLVSFHQTALDLRSQRQSMIASNIANADTPNYKARDMDFGSALRSAMQGRAGQPLALSMTTSRHLAMSAPLTAPNVQFRPESQSSVDGNTVDMDVERSAMAENSLHYEASLSFITGLLKSMQAAVTGQN